MTREEWMASLVEKPLFGDLIATDPVNAIRYHLTSGTTGRTPIRVLDSTKDWDWISEMWCYGLWGFGLRPEDIVYFAFGYGSFIGFWGAHYACEKMGLLPLVSSQDIHTSIPFCTLIVGDRSLLEKCQVVVRPSRGGSAMPNSCYHTCSLPSVSGLPSVWDLSLASAQQRNIRSLCPGQGEPLR